MGGAYGLRACSRWNDSHSFRENSNFFGWGVFSGEQLTIKEFLDTGYKMAVPFQNHSHVEGELFLLPDIGWVSSRHPLAVGVRHPCLTRERLIAARRATRHPKYLDETVLKRPLNFKMRSPRVRSRSGQRSQSGVFRLWAVEISKIPVLGQHFLQILLIHREGKLMQSSGQGQDEVKFRSQRSPYSKHISEVWHIFMGYFTRRMR